MPSSAYPPASPPLTTSRPQLARITASPEPTPPPAELPFEEHHAFVRTPQNMQEFLLLDQELTRLEGSGFKPVRSSAILPSSAFDSSASTALAPPPQQKKRQKKEHVAELIARLNADVLPFSLAPPPPPPSVPADTPSGSPAPAGVPPAPKRPRNPDEPLESLWWDIVGPCTASSSLLFSGDAPPPAEAETNGLNGHGHGSASSSSAPTGPPAPPAPPALAAGMPHAPWVGYCATPQASAVGLSVNGSRVGAAKRKGKARGPAAAAAAGDAAPAPAPAASAQKKGKKKRAAGRAGAGEGMSAKMRRNCETLRRIRRVGDTLARESTAGEMESPYVSAAEEDEEEGDDDALAGDNDAQERPAKRRRASKATGLVRVSGLPREALQSTATRGTAAREAMRAIGAGMLEHAGFEGASGGALDVLGHLAGEYLSNLGRTLRFYADRYSTDLSEKVRPLLALTDSSTSSDLEGTPAGHPHAHPLRERHPFALAPVGTRHRGRRPLRAAPVGPPRQARAHAQRAARLVLCALCCGQRRGRARREGV